MRVLLLSRYGRFGASSRVRSFQYLPFLKAQGWNVEVSALFADTYVQALYEGSARAGQVIGGYWRRLMALARVKSYDLLWIEKELFPFMPAVAESFLATLGIPYMADYDDALFHRYDFHHWRIVRKALGRKIDVVMKNATIVVAGNEYLAQRAREAGARRVEIVPTVVDLDKYAVRERHSEGALTIGWIGSPVTARYLYQIAPVLEVVKRHHNNVRIVAVGAGKADMSGLPVEVWPWSEENEVASIQTFDIGIMPLPDSPWERGKCGYKLIQYMACGLPVVASPVGVNVEIVEHQINGFLARNHHEWEWALRSLIKDREMRRRMGAEGRKRVEDWYSLQVQALRLEALMREALG